MSYDIRLLDPVTRETVEVEAPHLMQGGTYALGGTTELWLNVTYNYGRIYRRVMGEEGIRAIYGMTGAESNRFSKPQPQGLATTCRTTTGGRPRATRSARSCSSRRWRGCAPTGFGTAIDMEEEIMEEKIEGKKSEQMFMEELSGMLCAIVTMLSSISALSAALLAQSADERGARAF